jgi:hypothetical protein
VPPQVPRLLALPDPSDFHVEIQPQVLNLTLNTVDMQRMKRARE